MKKEKFSFAERIILFYLFEQNQRRSDFLCKSPEMRRGKKSNQWEFPLIVHRLDTQDLYCHPVTVQTHDIVSAKPRKCKLAVMLRALNPSRK